ncbi:MAG: acyltransferase [Hyphomicrobiales bacterium]|nr:acyltransferase [Hyphomicrobiales bacterium]
MRIDPTAGSDRASNNFEALRWIAASAVILAHAWGLRGQAGAYERATGLDLGWSAVVMFFALSGYLISASAGRRAPSAFWTARILRIFPGLLVSTFLTALAVSAVSRFDAHAYFTSAQTWKFVFGTGTLLGTEYALPGAFEHNVSTQANGSLWTLRYEVACYAIIFAMVWAARRTRLDFGLAALVGALGCAAAHAAILASGRPAPVQITNILSLFVPFALGAFFQARRTSPRLWQVAAGLAAAAALARTPLYTCAAASAIALLTLWLAHTKNRALSAISALPDYSYGIYIYAYPIQQIVILTTPGLPPLAQAAASFVLTLVPAALSWHFIEAPAMALKSRRPPSPASSPARVSDIRADRDRIEASNPLLLLR